MPVYKDNKRGKWFAQLNYTDSNGNHKTLKSKRFDTKGEASKCLAEMQMSHKQVHSYLTFNDIFREYLEEQKNKVEPLTYSHYQPLYDHMKDYIGDVNIEKLTVPQYKEFKKYLDNKIIKLTKDENGNDVPHYLSTSRKNRCHRFIKTLLKLAYDNHNIVCNVPERVGGFINPTQLESEDEEIKIITVQEFNRFLNEFKDDIVYKTLFLVLFYEGTRIGEALALTWKDLDLEKGILKINKTYTSKINTQYKGKNLYITKPKTKSSIRNIPIEKSTLTSLKTLKNYYSNFDFFNNDWFVFGGIKPLSETTITVKKDAALENAKVNRITIHQFRHSTASYLFEKGIKPTVVQKYLGHSKLTTTMNIYTHLYQEDLMNIHN